MKKPLVSVMMITYNHAPYIAQAIEGVLNQKTNFPFELVIGEDCSTDGTREIVFEYQKKFPDIIRVITSDENVGAKKNSYRALKNCRGKYIAYCEGDDYWHNPNKLQIQADYLERHEECGLVFSDHNEYHIKSKITFKNSNKEHHGRITENPAMSDIILGNSGIVTCTVMIRRILCDRIIESDHYLHQSDHFPMGDIQLWAEAAILARIHYMPQSLATYNILEESASHSRNRVKRFHFWKSALEMFLYLCDKHNQQKELRDKMESEWRQSILRIAFYEQDPILASEAKKTGQSFSWKERLWYYGAKNKLVYYTCLSIASFIFSLKKMTD